MLNTKILRTIRNVDEPQVHRQLTDILMPDGTVEGKDRIMQESYPNRNLSDIFLFNKAEVAGRAEGEFHKGIPKRPSAP